MKKRFFLLVERFGRELNRLYCLQNMHSVCMEIVYSVFIIFCVKLCSFFILISKSFNKDFVLDFVEYICSIFCYMVHNFVTELLHLFDFCYSTWWFFIFLNTGVLYLLFFTCFTLPQSLRKVRHCSKQGLLRVRVLYHYYGNSQDSIYELSVE